MGGLGLVRAGGVNYEFEFGVLERDKERATFVGPRERPRPHTIVSRRGRRTSWPSATIRPCGPAAATVRRWTRSSSAGTGYWNGRSGYRYEVFAVDQGDFYHRNDSVRIHHQGAERGGRGQRQRPAVLGVRRVRASPSLELRSGFARLTATGGLPTDDRAPPASHGQGARDFSCTIPLMYIPRVLGGALIVAAALASRSRRRAGAGRRLPPAPAPLRPPTRADILRGEYGRYRANNDLLSYHLDIRIDPGEEVHRRQEHHPLQDAEGRHAHPARSLRQPERRQDPARRRRR